MKTKVFDPYLHSLQTLDSVLDQAESSVLRCLERKSVMNRVSRLALNGYESDEILSHVRVIDLNRRSTRFPEARRDREWNETTLESFVDLLDSGDYRVEKIDADRGKSMSAILLYDETGGCIAKCLKEKGKEIKCLVLS